MQPPTNSPTTTFSGKISARNSQPPLCTAGFFCSLHSRFKANEWRTADQSRVATSQAIGRKRFSPRERKSPSRVFHATMATTYAFGRSLTAAAAGADLRFTFERDDAASGLAVPVNVVPYQLQGNPELHSNENTKKRMALKNDKRVRTQLERFWRVFGVGDNGTISEDEYLAVHVKMATVLIPDITPEEARAAGESDWLDDVQGAERMSKVAFMACLFEVADLYTTGIDGGAYATWLDRLFKRITVRLSTGPDGKIMATLPPKPTSARLREYRAFRLSLVTAGRVTAAEGPPPLDKPPTDAFAELERLRLAAAAGGGGGDGGGGGNGGVVDEAAEDGARGAGGRED